MIQQIPLEIQQFIFQYLNLHDLVELSKVNQHFRTLLESDNGYLIQVPAIATNRFILREATWYKTISNYARIDKSILNLAKQNLNLLDEQVKIPWVNVIPNHFGDISTNIASEPAFSNHYPYNTGQQLHATVSDYSKKVIIDFPTRSVRVENTQDTMFERNSKRFDSLGTIAANSVEYVFESQYDHDDHTMFLIRNDSMNYLTTAGITPSTYSTNMIDIIVATPTQIIYQDTSYHDKCSLQTEGLHYVRPYLVRTMNYKCSVINTETNETLFSNSNFAHPGDAQSTFITQTHFWSIDNNGLYCIPIESIVRDQAASTAAWTKILEMPPHCRIECISRFYTNLLALTFEGDAMILVDLESTQVSFYGFPQDLVRRYHSNSALYLKGFGYWLIDVNRNVLFIRTSYLESVAEEYCRNGYTGFVPLSNFSTIFDASGRMIPCY